MLPGRFPVSINIGESRFGVGIRGWSWGSVDDRDTEADATIAVEVRSVEHPRQAIVGFVHGRLFRDVGAEAFSVPVSDDHLRYLVEHALGAGFSPAAAEADLRVDDAGFVMADGLLRSLDEYPLPATRAPRYAGAAKHVVTARLGLATEDWMQDWPYEVADPDRIDEFIRFYDEVADDSARFDTMLLTLESCERRRSEGLSLGVATDWLARTLRRDFALHGHSIRYWGCLEHEVDDPEFRSDSPDLVWQCRDLFAVSGRSRCDRSRWCPRLGCADAIEVCSVTRGDGLHTKCKGAGVRHPARREGCAGVDFFHGRGEAICPWSMALGRRRRP